ncbi:MAG: gamma carbonic anhydrase family protein [Actinomycetales bacterium]
MRITLPDGAAPDIHDTAWVAPGAALIGRVRLGPQANVWYGCVLRADGDSITVGAESNVQDGTVVHADPGRPVVVGDGVTIGHRVVLHGCTIGENSLIGMSAIVLNGAEVGAGSLVGAGALVTEGMRIPPGSLVLGAPARVRRPVTEQESERIRANAEAYLELTAMHRSSRHSPA